MFMTDVLFSSPRLRFSDPQKKAVLTWATNMGAKAVPNLRALKMSQERLRKLVGDPTEKVTSVNSNVFHVNNVAHAIAKVSL